MALSNLVDTPKRVKHRKKRRNQNAHKSAKDYHTRLPTPHTGNFEIGSKQISELANKIGARDQALAEVQHESPIIWVTRNISTEKSPWSLRIESIL